MKLPAVTIYTDGSCLKNGSSAASGGWAAILSWRNKERELCGGSSDSPTSNRMELTAIIESLRLLTKPCKVTIVTDSKYACNRMENLDTLQENGWLTSKGCVPLNVDLLMQLKAVTMAGNHVIEWQYVKAHNGHPQNERCDALAKEQAKKFQVII